MALATVRTAATAMITAAATSNDAVNDARTAFPPTYHGQLTSGLRLPLLLVLRRREVQSGSALLGSKQSIVTKDHSNKKELTAHARLRQPVPYVVQRRGHPYSALRLAPLLLLLHHVRVVGGVGIRSESRV